MKVFLSYRRADDLFLAGRLRDRLAEDFGEENIFFDVDSIPPGTDFREVTRERIDAADVVLALIGSRWDSTRLARPNDYVRMELGESVRQHKPLIPVLIADTPMPAPDELPEELVTIAFLHALRIRPDPDFHDDSARLVEAVTGAKEGPTEPTRSASRWRWGVLAAAVAVAGGIAALAWAAGGDSNTDRRFEIAPQSGPVGTTIELHGDGCPAAPDDAVNRGIAYWLDSNEAMLANADVDGNSDAPWAGTLVMPADGSPETQYWVGAACWAAYSDGSSKNFYEYPTVPFDLIES